MAWYLVKHRDKFTFALLTESNTHSTAVDLVALVAMLMLCM